MFSNRIHLKNPTLAQRLGKYVRVGEAFLFFASDPQDPDWTSWLGHSEGPRIVSLLANRPVEVPGGTIEPLHLPPLRLDGITTDKAVYRVRRDTVHLLALALGRPGEQVSLVVDANGTRWAQLPVQLDSHGLALVPLRDLPSGEYAVSFLHASAGAQTGCTFTVAEYRLAPLVSSLVERRWNEAAARLVVRLRLETFGVAVTGGVRVELTDQGRRVAQVQAKAVDGLLEAALPLTGEGPHAINVQLEADPSRTATIPLIGSRAAERSSTLFSALGVEVAGSLLPGEGAKPVRGLFLSEGAERSAAFRLERVDTTRARLTATVAAGPVCIVVVDLLTHNQRQEVVRSALAAGEVLEIDVPGPAAVVLVGAFVEGLAWEGWAALVHPDRLTPRIQVPQHCAPDRDVTVIVETDGSAEDAVVYLVIKDARLLAAQTPSNCLAGQIKSAVDQLGVARSGIPPRFLDWSFQRGMPREIGDALVLRGVVSADQLAWARELARQTGIHPHHALARFGYATEEQIAQTMAAVHRLPFIDLTGVTIPPAVIELMPESVARENVVLPLAHKGGTLEVAMCDPTDVEMREKLQFILNKDIQPVVAVAAQIIEAINRHYGQSETESVDSMLAEFTDTAIDFTQTETTPGVSPGRRRVQTSIDLASPTNGTDESDDAELAQPLTATHEPEVVFAGLLPMQLGKVKATVRLGAGFTDYVAAAFVVSGLDWAAAESRFRAEKTPFVVLDLPAFVHRQDHAVGRVHAGARSGRMRLHVTCDGVPVPLQQGDRPLVPGEELIGQQVVVSLTARPGEYRATVEDLAGGSDQSVSRIEEPGKLRSVACSLRFLEPGQRLSRDEDDSILALRVLPGLDRPLHALVHATTDYGQACCEQTAAKILAGCAMYALAQHNSPHRAQAEAVIRAGVQREELMWLPGRGFKMYPACSDQPHSYLGPLAAQYLKHLALLEQLQGSFSPLLREAIAQGLKMADDALRAYRLAWPPTTATSSVEAYTVLRFSADADARTAALALVRRLTAGTPALADHSFLKGSVLERAETAFAAAALLRAGEPADRRRAWALADAVLRQLGPEGRLYSTADSVAAIALLAELRTVSVAGEVEVDGQRLSNGEAIARTDVRTLTSVAGVTAVEVTRRIEEDWDQLRGRVALRVALEKDGQADSRFRVGDGLDLHIRVEDGYQDGDLLWVCLCDALSWVLGGGQLKRFAVDLAGRSEVRVPLAATALTHDSAGQPAPQHFGVCLRNMFEEERAGNPGPLRVTVVKPDHGGA